MNAIKRILVVDDDDYNRTAISRLVEELGYHAETAEDGFEALAKVKLGFDLVLSDVVMPGMDGFEVVRKLRADPVTENLPVIMVTSLDSREDRLRAVESGANDYITKPVDMAELKIRMKSVLAAKDAQDALKKHLQEMETIIERRTTGLRAALDDMVTAQRQTHEAYLETIERLSIAAEFKDTTTAQHIKRMSKYCRIIADGLNLSPREAEIIEQSAPMHDVGKINIPDEILLKPSRLTNEEWILIQQHPANGAKLLDNSKSELLQAGAIIAHTHHEKWDGTGYPRQLSGDGIPLYGRICAVADVWDALTMVRPYKPSLSNNEAVRIIKEGKGTHFDPAVIEVFLDNLDEIEKVQREFNG